MSIYASLVSFNIFWEYLFTQNIGKTSFIYDKLSF